MAVWPIDKSKSGPIHTFLQSFCRAMSHFGQSKDEFEGDSKVIGTL